MNPAIRVTNLSKCYQLGQQSGPYYRTLRESLTEAVAESWRGLMRAGSRFLRKGVADRGEFWALSNVSFEVQPGEVVGIIGNNGAGKSTLLKILSRITEPTSGRAVVRGRIGSLLEVGTGFHPELTGRENIYLNGSILGMSRKEIDHKFDEIVAFSEIEEFLDTPVKRYSSGMYVRLAFAVAAHLEPELLIVDEVLAVGDARFQQKCLGKLGDVRKSGRTVLFVSHNLTAVKALCTRAIHLHRGKVQVDATAELAIASYLSGIQENDGGQLDLSEHTRRLPKCTPIMKEVRLLQGDGNVTATIIMGNSLSVAVKFASPEQAFCPVLGVVIKDRFGGALFGINNRIVPGYRFNSPMRTGVIRCTYPRLPLMPGTYMINLYLGNEVEDLDMIEEAISFEVLPDDVFGSGKLPPSGAGPFWLPASWTVEAET